MLAVRLAWALGVPYLELDALYHQPGWLAASPEEFRSAVVAAVGEPGAAGGWVADGNYRTALGDALTPDVVVWLDYPRAVVMFRVLRRTLARVLRRCELWNGNRENWRALLSREPETNIVLWAWSTHHRNRTRYSASAASSDVPWVRLRSPREAERWLVDLETQRRLSPPRG